MAEFAKEFLNQLPCVRSHGNRHCRLPVAPNSKERTCFPHMDEKFEGFFPERSERTRLQILFEDKLDELQLGFDKNVQYNTATEKDRNEMWRRFFYGLYEKESTEKARMAVVEESIYWLANRKISPLTVARAMLQAELYSTTVYEEKLWFQQGRCYLCLEPLGMGTDREHAVAISAGGGWGASNVYLAHPWCNRAKGTKPIWSPYLPKAIERASPNKREMARLKRYAKEPKRILLGDPNEKLWLKIMKQRNYLRSFDRLLKDLPSRL